MTSDIDMTNWGTLTAGYHDARDGEPLFPDAAPAYAAGWCYFHGITDPYATSPQKAKTDG